MESVLCQGAEATLILKDGLVHKSRTVKSYRQPALDDSLRLTRTRREAKALKKAQELGVPVPSLHPSEDKFTLVMDFIDGKRLRDVALDTSDGTLSFFSQAGSFLSLLHDAGLIHGDLTTSNILIADKLYLIDFGLSFFSEKIEDKAVDLHVLEEAIESTHYEYAEEYFSSFLEAFRNLKI